MLNVAPDPDVLPAIALLLLVFFSAPIIIGRVANLAGSNRLAVMVILLLLIWSISIPIMGFFVLFRGDLVSSAYIAATLGTAIMLAVPLILVGRLLARLIALRYAPTVADALASVIVGSIASFIPPVISVYLAAYFLANSTQINFSRGSMAKPLPMTIIISMIGVMILFTSGAVWILMGWGSMPVLRRRKGTVLGLVCTGLVIVFSIILTLLIISLNGIIIPQTQAAIDTNLFIIILLIAGSISIIIGMLTAGFMHGILVGLATFFDFAAFLATAIFVMLMLSISLTENNFGVSSLASIKLLILILALSAVQLRAALIGHRVASMLGLLLLGIPFVILFGLLRLDARIAPVLFVMFVLLAEWLGQWGVALRHIRYGGHISIVFLVITMVAIPVLFLLH